MRFTLYLLTAAFLCAQANDPTVLSTQGRQAMAAGNYAEAASHYRKLIALLPADAGLRLNLGLALFQSGNYRESATALRAALKLAPTLAPASMMLGLCHAKLDEPAAAIPLLEKAAAANPENRVVLLELADSYYAVGRHAPAIENFRRLTEVDPRNPVAWRGLGLSLSEHSQSLFTRLAPESAEALTLLANAKLASAEPKAAFTLLRRALLQNPAFAPAHAALATLYQQSGHPDWALSASARAGQGTGLFQEIVILSGQALQALNRLAALGPSAELYETEAEAARARGASKESVDAWRKALALRPGSRRLERGLARSLLQARDYEGAIPLLTKLGMRGELGEALVESGSAAEAIPLLLHEQGPSARAALGRAYLAAGEPAKAIVPLRAALPADKDGSLHFQLARALQRTGAAGEARRMDERSQELRLKLASQQEQLGQTEIGPL